MFEVSKLRPLGNRVLVERRAQETKTASGLIIPEAACEEKSQIGKVIAVGNGSYNAQGVLVPVQLNVGDIIFFSKHAGSIATDDTLLLREEEILGVFVN